VLKVLEQSNKVKFKVEGRRVTVLSKSWPKRYPTKKSSKREPERPAGYQPYLNN
jgi:hypothetical protein